MDRPFGFFIVCASLTAACSPWTAYRTARLRASEDLRCADERLAQVPLVGRNPSTYAFRGCGGEAIYHCVQHPSVTLCRRID